MHGLAPTCTAVAATGVFQLISLLALAVEAPKCVDTSAVVRADSFASGAFINVYSRRRDAGQIHEKVKYKKTHWDLHEKDLVLAVTNKLNK